MSFILDQDRMRSRMRMTILLYVAAVLALTVLLAAMVVVVAVNAEAGIHAPLTLPDKLWIGSHLLLVIATVLFVVVGIAGAAMYRASRLAEGGAVVARTLGGSLVSPDVRDRQRRMLRHVVEEIAIAAGIPVPEVYVMECEPGINILSAGHTHSDAILLVSRGCISHLDRRELQAVTAHQFVHILNGDARRNMRLTGALFGIMMISLAGRHIMRLSRSSGTTRRSRGPLALLGAALFAIGAPGYVTARLIQGMVALNRELRVDAATVQFTRDPEGLANAFRKMAAHDVGTKLLETDATEYAHFLIGSPGDESWPRTHPTLASRVELLDPPFDARAVAELRAAMRSGAKPAGSESRDAVAAQPSRTVMPSADDVARPSRNQVAYAGEVRRAIPADLSSAAHSMRRAVEAVTALLVDRRPAIAARQIEMIRDSLGDETADGVEALLPAARALDPLHRLPLVELAFPALKRRPRRDLARYVSLIDQLIDADGEVTVFEFALSRLVGRYLAEAVTPKTSPGTIALRLVRREMETVLAVLAQFGNDNMDARRKAFRAGMVALFPSGPFDYPEPGPDWVAHAGRALDQLDRLRSRDKEQAIQAMINVLTDDDQITRHEIELLRAVCAAMHCPMPPRIEMETR